MSTPAWAVEQGTTRGGDIATDAVLAAAAGFSALGFNFPKLVACGVDETARLLAAAGLTSGGIQGLPDLFVDPTTTLDTYTAAFDAAATLDAPGALVGTGPLRDRTVEEGDAVVRERLHALGALAAAHGTRVLFEPMHPILRAWNYVHTLAHAAELTDGLVGVALVADVGHLWWDRHLLDDLTRFVDRIGIVQLDDVPWSALDELRYERDRPGTGDVPLPRVLRTLHDAGYRGTYECEVLLRMPRGERPAFLADVRARLDDAWRAAGL